MPTWILEPHDPIIARDGRPFNLTPGSRATSLPFPMPSTTAGVLRALAGSDASGQFVKTTTEELEAVQAYVARGPLLVEIRDEQIGWMTPAPADALLLEHDQHDQALRKQLVPLALPDGALTDLTEAHEDLHLIGPRAYSPAKPLPNPPTFWHWQQTLDWLATPDHKDGPVVLKHLGHGGPTAVPRVHVGIEPKTQVADEGKLFQTRGLEFAHINRSDPPLETVRLGLALEAEQDFAETIAPLGGERRLVRWRKVAEPLPKPIGWIEPLSAAIKEQGGCRVLLLTPAYFAAGFRPAASSCLLQSDGSVQFALRGVAVGRAQTISGWDVAKNQPKPTRRLVPAGSVLFLELQRGEADDIHKWIAARWMQALSDEPQAQRDGFGLAIFGVWAKRSNISAGEHHAKNTTGAAEAD